MIPTQFPRDLDQYSDVSSSLFQLLIDRIHQEPFNAISLSLFILAVLHTFFAPSIKQFSIKLQQRHLERYNQTPGKFVDKSFVAEILHLFGEIEACFGLWTIPLLFAMGLQFDWDFAKKYLASLHYNEALLVGVVMTIASTRPTYVLFERLVFSLSHLFRGSIRVQWILILILGPLLGSVITEPAAIVMSAIALKEQFFQLQPSKKLSHTTLALLFANISIGGVLTNFAGHAITIVATPWNWDSSFMFKTFGWKALIVIVLSTFLYGFLFRKEFQQMETRRVGEPEKKKAPIWVSFVHFLFLAWILFNPGYIAVFVGSFFLFLGFYLASKPHQEPLNLKPPLLVTFFLAGLIVHVSLQGWWIEPVLESIHQSALMFVTAIFTAFNDNATVTGLSVFIPDLTEAMKFAIVAGAAAGGGLTIIGNAPNPAGQNILSEHFKKGVNPALIFFFALIPTMIALLFFSF